MYGVGFYINTSRNKCVFLFSICLLSIFLTWKTACPKSWAQFLPHVFSRGRWPLLFFFFLSFLSSFSQHFIRSWRAAAKKVPLLSRCPRAAMLRHPPLLQHRWPSLLFVALAVAPALCSRLGILSRDLSLIPCCKGSFKRWGFFFLWTPSPVWQWKICVCWVRFFCAVRD